MRPDAQGRGIGKTLLGELIRRCEALGYRQMIAVIGDSANAASIGLHESEGFLRAGTLRSVGFKFGRWVDSVIMQRPLGRGDRSPAAREDCTVPPSSAPRGEQQEILPRNSMMSNATSR